MNVVEPLIATQMQYVSRCTCPHNRSNSILCDNPFVCDNQDAGETRRVIDLKIGNQYCIIHMLVGIENRLYRITVCCGVRGRALASHTGVRRFDSRGGGCILLFADYKLISIYKS